LGLFEVPLTQSPGQRLDSISEYGYFGTAVGHNDLALNAPRLGLETERGVGNATLIGTLAFGEFKGSAYGGKPVFTGATTTAERPEIGLYARVPSLPTSSSTRRSSTARATSRCPAGPFSSTYDRAGVGADFLFFKKTLDFTAQQWVGRDDDPDGAEQRDRFERRLPAPEVLHDAAPIRGGPLRRGRQPLPDPRRCCSTPGRWSPNTRGSSSSGG
jgi:hypothetical protein